MARRALASSSSPPSPPSTSRPHLSRFAFVLSLLSLALSALLHHAYTLTEPDYPPGSLPEGARGQGAGSCRMSFMSPSYLHLSGFGREFTRLGNGPWGLYLYREAGWDQDPTPHPSEGGKADKLHLTGVPVLFVPGNAGSFRQVRSLAAAASRTWFELPDIPRRAVASRGNGAAPLDFFTLDFNDDFSAFHGQTLLDQAEYTADCVRYILSLYAHHEDDPPDHREKRPDPTSVIVVAHSMGGIVARAAVLNKNYQSGSISTMITFATPHLVPPVTVDGGVDRVYRAVNSYWREAYGLAPPSSAAKDAAAAGVSLVSPSFRRPPAEELADMVLISLSGGLSDLTIASETVSLLSLLPRGSTHGFTAFTTAVPGVQTPIDHLAILWCQQLMYAVAEGLLAIVDARKPERVVSREERVKELARRWVGESSPAEDGKTVPSTKLFGAGAPRMLRVGERLIVDSQSGERSVVLVPIPPSRTYAGPRIFSLLTSSRIGRNYDERVEVYACSAGTPTFVDNDPSSSPLPVTAACTPLFPSRSTLLPSSPHSSVSPLLPTQITADGTGLSLLEVEAEDAALTGMENLVVVVKGREGSVWVLGEWADRERRTSVVDRGMLHLAFFPYKLSIRAPPVSHSTSRETSPSPAALVSDLWIPALDSSLLTLRAKVTRGSCHDVTARFAPVLLQSSPLLHETKAFPNVRVASIYTHSGGPFLPTASSTLPYTGGGSGALVRLLLDPTCAAAEGAVSIEVEVDWMRTFGSLVVRYRMILVTVPFAVVLLVLARQLREFDAEAQFPSFAASFSHFTRHTLPLLLIFLLLASYCQSYLILHHSASHAAHPHLHASDAVPSGWISDALLGNGASVWAPVAPLLVFAMLGVVAVGYAVLWALVTGLAELVKLVLIWGPSAVKERFRATEPRDTLPLQRVVTMAALILAVVFFAPYQFAFLVLVLVHLFSTVRCLLLAQDASASSSPSSDTVGAPRSAAVPAAAARRVWARYHYSFSILFVLVTLLPINALILVVWVRNLAVGWLAPFSSDHNVLLLVGYLANVEALHGGRMLKGVESGSSRRRNVVALVTTTLITFPAIYSLVYGIRSAHRLFPFANVVMLFLATRAMFTPPSAGTALAASSTGAVALAGKRRTSVPPEPAPDLLTSAGGRKIATVRP